MLTRSFYLLQDFPGRWAGQPVWVEPSRTPASNGGRFDCDGVSPVSSAPTTGPRPGRCDDDGQPLFPVGPAGRRGQREMARRFGVNLVMYALTGNYKTDQVHVPALLERLGQ